MSLLEWLPLSKYLMQQVQHQLWEVLKLSHRNASHCFSLKNKHQFLPQPHCQAEEVSPYPLLFPTVWHATHNKHDGMVRPLHHVCPQKHRTAVGGVLQFISAAALKISGQECWKALSAAMYIPIACYLSIVAPKDGLHQCLLRKARFSTINQWSEPPSLYLNCTFADVKLLCFRQSKIYWKVCGARSVSYHTFVHNGSPLSAGALGHYHHTIK